MAFTERRFKQIKELSFPYFSLFLPIHMFIVSNATETGKYSMISHILTNSNERLLWSVYFWKYTYGENCSSLFKRRFDASLANIFPI